MKLSSPLARAAIAAVLFGTAFAAEENKEKKSTAHGHGHGHHGHGSKSGPKTDLGATAAFDREGTLWAAHKNEGTVVVSHSRDFGATWSVPVAVSPEPEPTDPGGDARPKIAFGPKGEMYLTWTRPMAKPFSGEIRFARSVDGGKTFDPPLRVHADPQEITHRFDAIAVDGTGAIFVAWIDKRDLVAAEEKGEKYRGAALYYAVSTDGGKSFKGDYKVADHSCECCRIAILANPAGGATVLWRHVFEPNIRDHALAELSANGQAGPIKRASFDDWAMDACPHMGPALTKDGAGRLHTVWFTGTSTNPGIFYGRPAANGMEGQRKLGGKAASRPDVFAAGQRLAVAWKEFDGQKSNLCALLSKDGGETWAEHTLSSTADASDQPQVLQWQDRLYVFWKTRTESLAVAPLP